MEHINFYFLDTFRDQSLVGIGKDADNFRHSASKFFKNFTLLKPLSRCVFLLPYFIFVAQILKLVTQGFYHNYQKRNSHKQRFKKIVFHPQIPTKRTALFPTKNTLHIVRMHDLFPITNPEWFPFGVKWIFLLQLRLLSIQNTIFVCNSQFTSAELRKVVKSDNEVKILECLISKPVGKACSRCKVCEDINKIPQRFALTVGTLEPRKNYRFLSKNWDSVWDETKVPLLIVGGNGWKIPRLENSLPSVFQLGKICDHALDQLYKKSSIYVAPSLAEGYDIPFHEALLYKIPILASDIASHKKFGVSVFTLNNSKEFSTLAINIILNQTPSTNFEQFVKISDYEAFWKDVSRAVLNGY